MELPAISSLLVIFFVALESYTRWNYKTFSLHKIFNDESHQNFCTFYHARGNKVSALCQQLLKKALQLIVALSKSAVFIFPFYRGQCCTKNRPRRQTTETMKLPWRISIAEFKCFSTREPSQTYTSRVCFVWFYFWRREVTV